MFRPQKRDACAEISARRARRSRARRKVLGGFPSDCIRDISSDSGRPPAIEHIRRSSPKKMALTHESRIHGGRSSPASGSSRGSKVNEETRSRNDIIHRLHAP